MPRWGGDDDGLCVCDWKLLDLWQDVYVQSGEGSFREGRERSQTADLQELHGARE
ncbi:MAG: hypothetical protein ABIJ44_09045 [Pseudomonadota bacterium]